MIVCLLVECLNLSSLPAQTTCACTVVLLLWSWWWRDMVLMVWSSRDVSIWFRLHCSRAPTMEAGTAMVWKDAMKMLHSSFGPHHQTDQEEREYQFLRHAELHCMSCLHCQLPTPSNRIYRWRKELTAQSGRQSSWLIPIALIVHALSTIEFSPFELELWLSSLWEQSEDKIFRPSIKIMTIDFVTVAKISKHTKNMDRRTAKRVLFFFLE